MGLNVRKIVVGVVALGVLLGVFVLYTRVSETPALTDARELLPDVVDDANVPADDEVGMIAGVGIGRVEQTQFLHTNEQNRVDREFGFEELLHRQGDQWEITRPYMKLFLPQFRCDVTADRGKVQLQTAFGQPVPSDADFSGNVVIHILPSEPNNPWECFIHLDNVEFLAEKSLFSTLGPVRFLSRNAQLTGKGMELLYDQASSRLDLFRIFHLDRLRLRSSAFGSVAHIASPPQDSGKSAGPSAAKPGQPVADPNTGNGCYQCVFRGNVMIHTPDRTVVARDLLAIHNIRWAGAEASGRKDSQPNPSGPPAFSKHEALDTSPSAHLALDSIPDDFFDVGVTCDGGFAITPAGATSKSVDPGKTASVESSGVAAQEAVIPPERQHATARRIDFDSSTTSTTLGGPVEMMFLVDPNAPTAGQTDGAPLPMTVTAQESIRFLAASKQVLLEGGCTVTLHKSEPNLRYEYTLTAPRLTLDLVTDPNRAGEAAVSVRRMVAAGGPVALRILKRGPDKLLGWTKLDASELEYTTDPREFTAIGPGVVTIHNAEAVGAPADPNQISLRQPCYAFLSHFDVLKYSAATSRVVADDASQQLLLDYFPLTDGKYGRHIQMVAGHIEGSLKEAAPGRMDLASLTASQGIDYEDERSHFIGSTLFYDNGTSLVTVKGDNVLPCYLNGALVDEIEINLKTGRIKAQIPTASVLQVRR
jgi:hypothetical protein